MAQTATGRNEKGQFAKGNKAAVRHGAYGYLATSKLPRIRGIWKVQKNLDRLRKELENSVPEMTVQKHILVDQVMKCQGFTLLFELYCKKFGLFDPQSARKGRLDFMPAMKVYLTMLNSQRNALTMLGINGQTQERILTPLEITQKESEHGNQND